MKKRLKPVPGDVTLRRIGDDAAEVIPADELQRRKEEADWERYRRSSGLDVWDEHERLALQLGDAITVPTYTADLWWFVTDVNGVDRSITARTFIFDQQRERTFPFDLVSPLEVIWGMQRREVLRWWWRIEDTLPKTSVAAKRARPRAERNVS